jgi:hypothetical protein
MTKRAFGRLLCRLWSGRGSARGGLTPASGGQWDFSNANNSGQLYSMVGWW